MLLCVFTFFCCCCVLLAWNCGRGSGCGKRNIHQLQVGESSPTLNAQTHNFSHTKNTVHVKSWNKKNANFPSTFGGERGMTLKWSNKMKLISHAMRERSWMTKLKFFSLLSNCVSSAPGTGMKFHFHHIKRKNAQQDDEDEKHRNLILSNF